MNINEKRKTKNRKLKTVHYIYLYTHRNLAARDCSVDKLS